MVGSLKNNSDPGSRPKHGKGPPKAAPRPSAEPPRDDFQAPLPPGDYVLPPTLPVPKPKVPGFGPGAKPFMNPWVLGGMIGWNGGQWWIDNFGNPLVGLSPPQEEVTQHIHVPAGWQLVCNLSASRCYDSPNDPTTLGWRWIHSTVNPSVCNDTCDIGVAGNVYDMNTAGNGPLGSGSLPGAFTGDGKVIIYRVHPHSFSQRMDSRYTYRHASAADAWEWVEASPEVPGTYVPPAPVVDPEMPPPTPAFAPPPSAPWKSAPTPTPEEQPDGRPDTKPGSKPQPGISPWEQPDVYPLPPPGIQPMPEIPLPLLPEMPPVIAVPNPVIPDVGVIVVPDQVIEVEPEPSPDPDPKPARPTRPPRPGGGGGGGNPSKPPKGTKEKKLNNRSAAGGAMVVINIYSEPIDFLHAIHSALPDECKSRSRSPYDKASAIWNCWDHLPDDFLADALAAVINNQIEDMYYGKLGQFTGKASGEVGAATGLDKALQDAQESTGVETELPEVRFEDGELIIHIPGLGESKVPKRPEISFDRD